jgi:fumarate hydratase subunit alpha
VRKIKSEIIISAVEELISRASFELPKSVVNFFVENIDKETSVSARQIFSQIIENSKIAKSKQIPLCQDTGSANFFIKLGNEVMIENGLLPDAINKGVSLGYEKNFLRKSIVSDPIERKNTGNNTPANIYIDIVFGDKIEISFLPKGGGSENASVLKMFTPSAGWDGIKNFILSAVKEKGADACPPLIVGIGIGSDFSSVGLLAKKAILRDIKSVHSDSFYAKKEKELLKEINKLDLGAMGMGGDFSAIAVFIETRPCHIASLPVAVNMQCHSCRKQSIVL